MTRISRRWLTCLLILLVGCAEALDDQTEAPYDDDVGTAEQALAGASAAGTIPAGLPSRVLVGLFEDTGQTWMKSSNVRWDARYRYFTKGWVNNWGWSAYDGSWGLNYLRECDTQGYVPALQYYQLFGETGGGEAQTLAKVQNATTMRSYFGDFKILMQRVKDFGKPVMVLIEADAYGFLQQQAANNPSAYAAIAASGMPELASLPNTVAGWGLAFLQLKQAVGASNAILGVHVSAWASGKDIAYSSATDALGPEVDKVYAFLSPLGLAANLTGATYDVLVGDPLDRDSDYYRLSYGQDRWWDASDSASISSKSFNRYAEWLRLWNQKAGKRWVLWQIPLGNSNHKNVYNNGGSAEGYKDNRPEYFFANGTAHITKFADAGVIALLFGAGAGGMSTYTNDTYSDGQLFMKSRAGAILSAGGVPLGSGGTTPPFTCASTGTGNGLRGDYFSGTTLASLVLSRTDATVDFSWGTAAPASVVAKDNFSVRWSGQLSPRSSGPTTFYTQTDDGVRLWINGQLVIDNWTDHGTTENGATLTLTAGQRYDVKLEYYERTGGAVARLMWSNACDAKQVIPTTQLYASASVPSTPSVPSDTARFAFESDAQGWTTTGGFLTSAVSSSDRAYRGLRSLKVSVSGGAGSQRVFVPNPAVPAGATVTFNVYVPAGSTLGLVQPYVLQGAAGGWAWTGNWRAIGSLSAGQWNAISVVVPAGAAALAELGVEISNQSTGNFATYVDAVNW
ncbi:MAG: PA14 domain-containing protein [Myxococcales bacterium]